MTKVVSLSLIKDKQTAVRGSYRTELLPFLFTDNLAKESKYD